MAENQKEVRVTLRLPPNLHELVRELAKADSQSLNAELVQLIWTGLPATVKRVADRVGA